MKKHKIIKTPALQDTPFVVAILQGTIEDLLDRVAGLELKVIQLENRLKNDRV